MAEDFTVSPRCPGRRDGIIDVTAATRLGYHNGQPSYARVIQPIERACQHLAIWRKLSCGGVCRPFTVAAMSSEYLAWRLNREAYARDCKLTILYSTTGTSQITANTYFQVDIDPGSGAQTWLYRVIDSPRPAGLGTANVCEAVFQIGEAVPGDTGTVVVELTIAADTNNDLLVYSVSIEPLGLNTFTGT